MISYKNLQRRCGFTIALGIAMLALLLVGSASASTLIVNASGGEDYSNIQAAIDNASDGDTIVVQSGTYNENVNINKSVTMLGNNTGSGLPVVNAINPNLPVIELNVNGIVLDGFNATNSTNDSGIDIDSSNNILTNNSAYSNLVGIEINSVYLNNTIYKNKMYNNSINAVNDNSTNCRWNTSVFGNYYDNITSVDNNNDGINDIPYSIDANGTDYLPLIVTSKAESPDNVSGFSPFIITTNLTDHASVGIQNVSLYFNLSNSSGIYTFYGNNLTGTFTFAPLSSGDYYFYTVTIDKNGVVESTPTIYDSRTNVIDNTVIPPVPELSPLILTSAGVLGLLFLVGRNRR